MYEADDLEMAVPTTELCSVAFFSDDHFEGVRAKFYLGYFNVKDFTSEGIEDNTVSSFQIIGHSNCAVTLYGEEHFQGWSATFGPGTWSCNRAMKLGFVNDDTTSFHVELLHSSTSTTSSRTATTWTGPTLTTTTVTTVTRTTTITIVTTTTATTSTTTATSTTLTSTTVTRTTRTRTTRSTRTSTTVTHTTTSATTSTTTTVRTTRTRTTATRTTMTRTLTSSTTHTTATRTTATTTVTPTSLTFSTSTMFTITTWTSTVTTGTITTSTTTISTTKTAIVFFKNGDFEMGSVTSSMEFDCSVPFWTFTGPNHELCPIYVKGGLPPDHEFGGTGAADGDYFLALRGIGAGIEQYVGRHESGEKHRLDFYIAKPKSSDGDPRVQVTFSGADMGTFNATSREMTVVSIEYTPPAPYVYIRFANVGPDDGSTVFIDKVSTAPL